MNRISNNNEVRMTSKELCDLINIFRKEEGNETEKEHKDLMKSIRTELEVLANAGIDNGGNFSLVEYIDSKGEKRPCYSLTKDAVMQMLNKESAVVRYKTQQYIKTLEEQLIAVNSLSAQQPLQIAPRYSYNNYWIKRELSVIKPTDIPDYVDGLLEYIKSNKAADRLTTYEITRAALQDLQPTFEEAWQREMVQSSINRLNDSIERQRSFLNRADKGAKTKRINSLEQDNRELAEELDHWRTYAEELEGNQENEEEGFYLIPKSGFSANYMYSWDNGRVVKSKPYRRWINDLHLELYLPEHYPNVDFDYPVRITAMFGQKEGMDTNNFGKALIDQIANYYGFDDCLVYDSRMLLHDFVESYEDGYIFIRIENI